VLLGFHLHFWSEFTVHVLCCVVAQAIVPNTSTSVRRVLPQQNSPRPTS
jgi:hypothetical protein